MSKLNGLRAFCLAIATTLFVASFASTSFADAQFRFRVGGEWCNPAQAVTDWDSEELQWILAFNGLFLAQTPAGQSLASCPIPTSPEFVELSDVSPQNRKVSFVQLRTHVTDTSGSKYAQGRLYTYDYDATGFCTCDTDTNTTFTSNTNIGFTLDFGGDAGGGGCSVALCSAGWATDWLLAVEVWGSNGTSITIKSIAAIDTST